MTNDNEMTNVACARRVAVGTLHARRYQLQLHVDGHVLLHHGQLATKQGHHSTNAEGIWRNKDWWWKKCEDMGIPWDFQHYHYTGGMGMFGTDDGDEEIRKLRADLDISQPYGLMKPLNFHTNYLVHSIHFFHSFFQSSPRHRGFDSSQVIFYLVNYPDDDIKPLGFANREPNGYPPGTSAWNLAVDFSLG